MKTVLSITLDVAMGANLTTTINEATELAIHTQCEVRFKFNGKELVINKVGVLV